jgi:Ni,Fe-hydrogenase III small subunit/ferredoxin
MAWALRGLRNGIVTSGYPRQPDAYGEGFRSAVSVLDATDDTSSDDELAALCPTGAIGVEGRLTLDRGRCILCGRCVDARPDRFAFEASPEVAVVGREALLVPYEDDGALQTVRSELAQRVRLLRRSIHIRHVDAGSDGSDEWEVAALTNPVYDVLLVTGVGTAGMAGPLRRTFEAMPHPKVVLAAGSDAVSGGLVHPSYAGADGIGSIVPVDVFVPGSPSSPFSLLHGICVAVGLLGTKPKVP